jgi:hypothetical protein
MAGLWQLLDAVIPDFTYMIDARLLLAPAAAAGWLWFERKTWNKHK